MNHRLHFFLLLATSCCLYSCSPDLPKDVAQAYKELPAHLDYNLDVKPILSDKCFACHGPDKAKQKASLRLDLPAYAYAPLPENPGKVAIAPGNWKGSEVFYRILSPDPRVRMPTPASHLNLSAKEKAVLVRWIDEGANYQPHWAFVRPEKQTPPVIKNKNWPVRDPIDNFILAKLETENRSPSPEADKSLLLRRVSLDLTGLPPTLSEIDAFQADHSPNAYEKQVDRLLNSPHYGEKMAVDWLDLARFADSHGYTVDHLRDMSPYRDWVIDAFNHNMPYDRFIQWQLAGDLMPNPTKEMLISTAFNRNHPQNMEGGVVEEEFQTEYVIDRTNTFGNAFLGIQVGCAKCHDHKYDPISQKNYYELTSFFNNVKEAGQISFDDALPTPTLLLPTREKEKVLEFMNSLIRDQEKKTALPTSEAETRFLKWMASGNYLQLGKERIPLSGLQGCYDFDNGSLKNKVDPRQQGVMKREMGQAAGLPSFEKKDNGQALVLNGDDWLDLQDVGVFRKSDPFSIGIRVNIPATLTEGVLFHKSVAERLYNFRGYQLYLKDNRLQLNMAHTGPSNAITRITRDTIPRDKWIQLTVTYDGSSKAAGFRLFLDGVEMNMETTMDQLTKDILFSPSSLGFTANKQPALQIGGWWRGRGFKGGRADDITVYRRVLTPQEIKILAGQTSWAQTLAASTANQLSTAALSALRDYYYSTVDPGLLDEQKKLQQLRTALADSTEDIDELMVMQEMPRPKKTHILIRGNYDAPGEEVFPNTPPSILPFPPDLPKNRYGLAQWLTRDDHPLTARVEVNRLWQNFFGIGLVRTTEDFGNQGEMPSHPKLLDWLAVTFRESGWDIKKLNKLIVLSATYRQDSRATREARDKDPENRLLAHGPAFRLSAEMIRDNALQASGLLNPQIGGKSVKPYQPEGLWEINNASYSPDSGQAVYRRSLYVLVKRSVPNPTLATFDAPSRSYCIVRRQNTNTPLQALVTLNDPAFVEAARAIGAQMAKAAASPQPSVDPSNAAITAAYRKLTGRTPLPAEVELLRTLKETEENKFRAHPAKAAGWLNTGQYQADKKLDPLLVAAYAVVASAILNSDAALTKR